jgi:uroporphyrinogen decarboxylase
VNRRQFIQTGGTCIALGVSRQALGIGVPHRVMTHIERVDAALQGRPVDRPPYTIYRSFEQSTPESQAHAQLRFHEEFNTDIVKMMNPYPYPASESAHWSDLKVVDSPFPDQLMTVQMIGRGLKKRAHFVDTIGSPFTTAWLLFNRQRQVGAARMSQDSEKMALREFRDFQNASTDAWHGALEAITQSLINHIHKLREIGASGVYLTVVNSSSRFGNIEDYNKFSRPYDEHVLRELSDMPLTILRLENLDQEFQINFPVTPAPVVHYSTSRTGISIAALRKSYSGVIMGGVDEIDYDRLRIGKIRKQWSLAWAEAGPRYIVAHGGPIPDGSTGRQIGHLQDSLSAW